MIKNEELVVARCGELSFSLDQVADMIKYYLTMEEYFVLPISNNYSLVPENCGLYTFKFDFEED